MGHAHKRLTTIHFSQHVCRHKGYGIRNAEDKQVIVCQCFRRMPVEQSVKSPLHPTGWTVPPREQTERTLGHPHILGRVEK